MGGGEDESVVGGGGTVISYVTMDTLDYYDRKQQDFQREVMDGDREVKREVMKQKKRIDIRNKRAIEKREEEEGFGVGVFERMGIRGRKDS